MAARLSRFPIVFAVVALIFLTALWVGRDKTAEHPLNFISSKFAPRLSFYEIAMKYGTDKVTDHHYERIYEHRLAPLRDLPIKMLEIGLGCNMAYGPGASYYTWLEYFPQVDLYYIEYNGACATQWTNKTEKATVFSGDQADVSFLQNFLKETDGQFDVIIDDGGHTMHQQRTSLKVLWENGIKPGGIYFIEDLQTSYMPDYGDNSGRTFMNDLKDILDDMNKYPAEAPPKFPVSRYIINFEFTQNVVALTKAEGPI